MDTENEINNALAELAEFYDFYMEISELPARQMVECIEKRDPEFIEHIEAMEKPPKDDLEFWSGFGIWTITGLRSKYSHIWHKVVNAYFRSSVHKQSCEKWKLRGTIWSQIDEILKNSNL